MKKLLLASSALVFGGQVFAADLPARMPLKAPVTTAVPSSWTGFYFGGHVGGAWGTHDYSGGPAGDWALSSGTTTFAFLQANETPALKSKGFIGGGQFGYNYQSGNIVWGLEADGTWLSLKSSRNTGAILDPLGFPTVFTESAKVDWLMTVRPRLGIAVDKALFFVTGGLAVGHVASTSGMFRPLSGLNTFGSASSTNAGWTAGGGLEYMLTPNWSVGAQYLYVDLGKVSYRTIDQSLLFPTFFENLSVKTKLNLATISINYKFGPEAVVARY